MKVAIIGSKKNTKSLAMEIAIKCNIPIVVKSFVCDCNKPNITWYGNDSDKKYFCFSCKKEAN
jgi:hypothetical protein